MTESNFQGVNLPKPTKEELEAYNEVRNAFRVAETREQLNQIVVAMKEPLDLLTKAQDQSMINHLREARKYYQNFVIPRLYKPRDNNDT